MPGRGHFERGIKSEYLEVLGPVFAHSVRPLLVNKDLWSLKLEEVFSFQFVFLSTFFFQTGGFFSFTIPLFFPLLTQIYFLEVEYHNIL